MAYSSSSGDRRCHRRHHDRCQISLFRKHRPVPSSSPLPPNSGKEGIIEQEDRGKETRPTVDCHTWHDEDTTLNVSLRRFNKTHSLRERNQLVLDTKTGIVERMSVYNGGGFLN